VTRITDNLTLTLARGLLLSVYCGCRRVQAMHEEVLIDRAHPRHVSEATWPSVVDEPPEVMPNTRRRCHPRPVAGDEQIPAPRVALRCAEAPHLRTVAVEATVQEWLKRWGSSRGEEYGRGISTMRAGVGVCQVSRASFQ